MQIGSDYLLKFIPGHISPEEGEWLAKKAAGGIAVEIGSYRGKSTCYIASKASKVISCDAFCGQKIMRSDQKEVDFRKVKEDWYNNISRFEFQNNVKLYAKLSEEIYPILLSIYRGKIDLVFVDGGHDKTSIRFDVCYANLLRKNGIIAFHDYLNSSYPDVQSVVTAWSKKLRNKISTIISTGRIKAYKIKHNLNISLDWWN